MIDKYGRSIDYIRISLTDRCNLKCIYCRDEILESIELLTANDIIKIVNIISELGVKKVKLTGGEPLIRSDFEEIVREIRKNKKIESLTITTNGIYLKKYANVIKKYIDCVNISIDTLDFDKYEKITGFNKLKDVIDGIECLYKLGVKMKINSVLIKNLSESFFGLFKLCEKFNIDIRFIELMPLGDGKKLEYLESKYVFEKIEEKYGKLVKSEYKGNGPCIYYECENLNFRVGFISAISDCFCSSCNRIRITSDGFLKLCLYYSDGINIKSLLKYDDNIIKNEIIKALNNKPELHKFGEFLENSESKNMSQIGG